MAGALERAAERLTGDSSGEQPDRLAARMVTLDQEIGRLVEALAHRSALVNNPQESRDLLKVLIEDRLVVRHLDGEAEWELRGMGSLEALVVRAAQNLASPPGFGAAGAGQRPAPQT